MATYGVKYELKFSDNRGHKRTLEILKKDYEGDVLPIVGTGSPAIIRYENQDDFYNPIIGSSCEINIKVTDSIAYDEFSGFNEREYKVRILAGQEDDTITLDSPLWEVANTNWEDTETLWAKGQIFEVYWEGFLIFDNYIEQFVSSPYDLKLVAIDNLGTLDSYNCPYGSIQTDAAGNIKVAAGEQNNYDTAFYYIKEILKLTGLDFDIYIQNNIRGKIFNTVIRQSLTLFHDINIHEFGLAQDFVRRDAKEVLKEILINTNSRIFQSNASWYIISNHNYYDRRVIYDPNVLLDELEGTVSEQPTSVPSVATNLPTNVTSSSATLNGQILDDRGINIINRGFYFGTSTIYNQNVKYFSTDTTDAFTLNRTGLSENQIYYVTAFANNNINEEGIGATRSFIAQTTTTSVTPGAESPVVETLTPLATQVFDDRMTLRGQVTDIGDSNVTEYGFYFGTDAFNYENNTKYAVTTSANESAPFTFTLDTSSIPITLTAGQAYYINAYAVNTAGTKVGNMKIQETYNVWNLYNIETNAIKQAIYDDTYTSGDGVRLSDSGTDCFTIIQGTTIPSTSGIPTITILCPNEQTTQEVTTEEITTCNSITLFRASTSDAVCCNDISVETFYINGPSFTSTDTTAVYTDFTCETLASAQYFSRDLVQYRYFNGTTLGAVTNCGDCGARADDPNAYIAENETTGERVNVLFSTLFSPGQSVVISSDNTSCYTIVGSIDVTNDPTVTISRACDIVTTQPPETCPTMTFFAEYQGCGDDNFVIIGNNKNELPNIVKQISTGLCFFKVRSITTDVQNDNFNLGCYPTPKFELGNLALNGGVDPYISCDDCLGNPTTTVAPVTTTTTAPPSIFYRIYLSLQSNCSQDDIVLEVSNSINSFPSVISDGVICYSSDRDGGSGGDGDVDEYLNFADCPDCQAYLATTTTPAPVTTQAPCSAFGVYIGTTAVEACCGGRSVTVYGNGSSLAQSTVIYTDFLCSEIVTPGNYVRQANSTYFWNGRNLSLITCPACP